jgi:hypothetical protein
LEEQSSEPPTEFSYGNSLGRFFCWFMLQVLQEDCGVAYHPDRKFDPDFCNPEDVFIHGILNDDGKGGTCASMPVVYVAIGQRLGLPVYLVQTRGHLFFRWDDPQGTLIDWETPNLKLWIPPDRFNVEGAGEGIAFSSDSHYIQWPELWTEKDFEHGRYLQSMTTGREILADFLIQRAECFHDLGNINECLESIFFARKLAPDDPRYEWLHAKRTKECRDREDAIQCSIKLQQERRSARDALPAISGHSKHCRCGACEKEKDLYAKLPTPPHGDCCTCRACSKAREAVALQSGISGHGLACECVGCYETRKQKKAAEATMRHSESCQCAQCIRNRTLLEDRVPGHPPACQCPACVSTR